MSRGIVNAYTKPFLSYGDLLNLLTARGLSVPDPAEAQRILTVVGYYRLSGYWYPFRAPDPGGSGRSSHFRPGTTLNQVLALYDMDRRLKLLTMDAVERVEIAMRVRLGHTLGARDTYAHEDPNHLDGVFTRTQNGQQSKHSKWLTMVAVAQQRSKEDFVQHFDRRYGGRLPIWALTEIMDFGSLSHLYSGALRPDRDSIAKTFGVIDGNGQGNGRALGNWMHVLNYLRNTSAHHSRLWNRNMTVQIAPSHLRCLPDLAHIAAGTSAASDRVYGALAVLAFLLKQIHPTSSWCAEVRSVIATGMTDSGRSDREMGCPPRWESLPLWT